MIKLTPCFPACDLAKKLAKQLAFRFLERRQQPGLGTADRLDQAGDRLATGVGDGQSPAALVSFVALADDPAFFLETADHRTGGGRIQCNGLSQPDLIHTRLIDQGIENGKLHLGDVGIGSGFHEQRHGHLMGATDQVPGRIGKVEMAGSGDGCAHE